LTLLPTGCWLLAVSLRVVHESNGLRVALLRLPRGVVETPAFMPVATRGAIRTAPFPALKDLGASVVLGNTYHLFLRPGIERIRRLGGLHRFIGWDGPILTDSGGFQVFSLALHRTVSDEGVRFRSPLDGADVVLTPESVMEAQEAFGSDVAMVLDEVVALPASQDILAAAVDRTTRWAARAKNAWTASTAPGLLFGIVQGGTERELRERSARELLGIGFDGYAIGGLAVGEARDEMLRTLEWTVPLLPADRPRYLMGVGEPEDIVEAVRRGVDLFDCVLPTRNARHELLYDALNEDYLRSVLFAPLSERVDAARLYRRLNITNERFAEDAAPVNVRVPLLVGVTHAYLRHLFQAGEPLAPVFATLHNLSFYLTLMSRIRASLQG
jgi:queuine tRNA-ribosyltransferase